MVRDAEGFRWRSWHVAEHNCKVILARNRIRKPDIDWEVTDCPVDVVLTVRGKPQPATAYCHVGFFELLKEKEPSLPAIPPSEGFPEELLAAFDAMACATGNCLLESCREDKETAGNVEPLPLMDAVNEVIASSCRKHRPLALKLLEEAAKWLEQ